MKRLALVASAAAATTILLASPALAAAPSVTMDPAGVLSTDGRQVTVSGTYRCDPSPIGASASLGVTLTQQTTAGNRANSRGIIVPCTGQVEPYSVDTVGSVLPGPARYRVVLNAVPTNEQVIADGALTVA